MHENQLLTVGQVASILGVSISGVWAKDKKEDDFPKSFKLSAAQTRWRYSEVDAFINLKMATRH